MTTPLAQLSLLELAKKTLDNDDEEPTQAYMDALQKFRDKNPLDLNFIVELGKVGRSVGGNGFGTATCMEDYCWTDVMLDADPELPDGGKGDGIGSLFNYQEHCKDADHVKGRTQRIAKQANAESVAAPKIFQMMDKHHQTPSSSSSTPSRGKENTGIPRTGSTSSSSLHPERALQQLPSNVPVKLEHDRKGKGKELKPTPSQLTASSSRSSRGTFDAPVVISDGESDDEVLALGEDEIPDEFKKKSNKDCPIEFEDDEDEVAPPPSAVPPAPLAEIFTRPASSQAATAPRPTWTTTSSQPAMQGEPSTQNGVASQPKQDIASQQALATADLARPAIPPPSTMIPPKPAIFTGDIYATLDKSASYSMATWETTFLNSEAFKAAAAGVPAIAASVSGRRITCNLIIANHGKIKYDHPSNYLLAYFPTYRTQLATWESSIRKYLGKKGLPSTAGSSSALPNALSSSNLTMPGQYSSAAQAAADPSHSAAPAAQDSDIFARNLEYGYEMDRPQTSEGLNQLFQTAFEDCADDIKVEEALKGLDLQSMEDLLPGLECRLMPHQVIGVHWMVKQEKKRGTAGGILGDEMGLGKTVQAIGTMVKNPSTIPRVKATLVIVPTVLLEQWKSEIETKSNLTALIYHGAKRTKSANVLKNADVVITSYGTMTGERPQSVDDAKQKKKKKRKQPGEAGYDSFVSDDDKEFERPRKTGLLFQIEWYRIILDEAAVIRNKNTIASKAVVELKSRINWCLSGTLIYNKLDDIFPYLRFIGAINWEDFRAKVSSPAARKPRLASKRAQALLKPVMLRRTKESELDGKKILQLPPKTVEVVQLDFSPEERAVYVSVEQRARVRVNKYLRAGTVLKHYHVILVMLMRLRQLCCHPWLLRAKGNQISPDGLDLTVTDDDIFGDLDGIKADDESEYGRAVALQGQPWVDKVVETLKKRQEAMSDDLPPATQARAADDENDYNCPVCFEPYTDEVITACQHSFCAQCIEDVLNRPENDHRATEDQMNRRACLCPLCRAEITKQRLFRAAALHKAEDEDGDDEDEEDVDVKPGMSSKKRSSDAANQSSKKAKIDKGKGRATMDINDDELDEEDLDERGIEQVVPSTKMKEAGDVLDEIYDADPAQKTLIFCSFVEMLELMEVFLERRRIPHIMYTGKLKQDERTDAIARFNDTKNPKSPRVMLISMKCGGVGLNLTAANNVICLDMAWSPAAELQAIDRAHRIGQTRPVSVKRMVIKDSVDERILALQEKKQALADGALGEGSGGKLGRLTAQELVRLFGHDDDF